MVNTSTRRTQAERRRHTRQALLDAALLAMAGGESFDRLSLRQVTRAAGVAPAAFYRHFAGMEELGLALVEDSFRTLRAMLRDAREQEASPEGVIRRSVQTLSGHVRENREHFAFIARTRASGDTALRHAIRTEIRLVASELATDLGRFPELRDWRTEDLLMLAGLLVTTMIATVEAIVELPPEDPAEAITGIERTAERHLLIIALGASLWRSSAHPPPTGR